jgi:hypothetical protein
VPTSATITAADVLTGETGRPDAGRIWLISDLDTGRDPSMAYPGTWLDDLAVWANSRADRNLADSVVKLTAPELSADELISAAQLAQIAKIAASTLRAYIARDENEVPPPQAYISGRAVWSRPVAQDWVEVRRRSHEGLTEAVAGDHPDLPVGVSDLWVRYSRIFSSKLWVRNVRRRWALRWRNRGAVDEIAHDLAWLIASDVGNIVPVGHLAATVRIAILSDFDPSRYGRTDIYGLSRPSVLVLDWLIRHAPEVAAATIGDIVGEAERGHQIARDVTERSVRTALSLDSKLTTEARADFLMRAFSPSDR